MEDNIFNPTSENNRPNTGHGDDIPLPVPPYRENFVERHSIVVCLILIIAEIVGGFLANSMALLMDATRLFADILHPILFDRSRPAQWKKGEIIAMYVCAAFLLLVTALFLYFASQRLYASDYDVGPLMMLLFALVGQTANCILLYVHYAKDWRRRRDSPTPAPTQSAWSWASVARFAHSTNHSLSIVVLLAAVFVLADPAWEWMDSYATFIVAFLTIANLAATVGDSTNEWRGLRNRADYEPI